MYYGWTLVPENLSIKVTGALKMILILTSEVATDQFRIKSVTSSQMNKNKRDNGFRWGGLFKGRSLKTSFILGPERKIVNVLYLEALST